MTQIRPRPIHKKNKITREQEKRYMATFREIGVCEACGIANGTIVPAHFNLGEGGTGYRAPGLIAGLCFACHNLIDRRVIDEKQRTWVLEKLCQKLLRDRARIKINEIEKAGKK